MLFSAGGERTRNGTYCIKEGSSLIQMEINGLHYKNEVMQ